MRHFISTRELSAASIFNILNTAEEMRENPDLFSGNYFAANLFFEPSTRTKMSFLMAEKKLGMEVLDFQMESSSMAKGESLYDTARTYEAIGADLLIVRHKHDRWFDELAQKLSVPMINAGSGKRDHPTQSMLDLLTIYQEFGSFNNLNIVIAGDIKHSRVARSNAYALRTMGANVYFSAAPGFEDDSLGIPYMSIDEACEMCDVLMLLRVQHERHATTSHDTSSYLVNYGLTPEREQRMQDHAIILHPAPVNRGVEIDTGLVECERSRIFKQMENGVYTRMAIISILLNEWGFDHEHITEKCQTLKV
ncbi:aspartate carbamoyltransferase catalytic subunit [Lentibacillus sp. CBA3610]|uniref:aspartate carbamoyltransferase catalytic subunit n=1 Tax=Lentibacillus sp. CBA3610 TaxID=2518176 RepID=UPI001595B77C|nr:aspartate carbamoyltransferase catalytic subunit [Lentibacillus sp. CBA3610]QKY68974.1 aspartate carbamoyltransferase catalytic subunit [Lentibacillus sp. CBA3610]